MHYILKQNGELYHHGIKGQKWGIRRYQNPDGTLTPAGRERYGYLYEDNGKMRISKYDSIKTRSVKADYNKLSKEDFKSKYKISKEKYNKNVMRYGDPSTGVNMLKERKEELKVQNNIDKIKNRFEKDDVKNDVKTLSQNSKNIINKNNEAYEIAQKELEEMTFNKVSKGLGKYLQDNFGNDYNKKTGKVNIDDRELLELSLEEFFEDSIIKNMPKTSNKIKEIEKLRDIQTKTIDNIMNNIGTDFIKETNINNFGKNKVSDILNEKAGYYLANYLLKNNDIQTILYNTEGYGDLIRSFVIKTTK